MESIYDSYMDYENNKYAHKDIYQFFPFIIGKLTSRHLECQILQEKKSYKRLLSKIFFLGKF